MITVKGLRVIFLPCKNEITFNLFPNLYLFYDKKSRLIRAQLILLLIDSSLIHLNHNTNVLYLNFNLDIL